MDIFDRERVFIDRNLAPLCGAASICIVFEHITTKEAAQFVTAAGENDRCTITAHHLLLNRNAIFVGGIRPHHFCLPVLKRETHREALVEVATRAARSSSVLTSAPHSRSHEAACGCAGCYSAHAGIELYAEAFEVAGALDRLEGIRELQWSRFLSAATQHRHLDAGARCLERATGRSIILPTILSVPAAGGRADRLAPRLTGTFRCIEPLP